ncbi:hypothetical protein HBI38_104710 [Parastagonospora nodorum]|nr:hypothetical protein HBH50_146450 [Parastagonospora nodorum]KAH4089316.1 hypothetical protein HBH48_111540 [Parastagonospora nodorum]KAH4212387.1 hypothetical protein HBI95_036660 [Parastagonospora nodorum]KAH4270370.1 hypothetical protein HBI03_043740 [Parastagonospora nodorum]KAH4278213.1 hypothetical protein HBI04_091110 [Parastagonospora nodorum]
MTVQVSQPTALPEGDRYYLLRGNIMVPLVPADQIPLQLRGLPRQLTHRQLSDENWKLLHESKHAAFPLAIHVPDSYSSPPPTSKASPGFLAPDHHVRSSPKHLNEVTTETCRLPPPAHPAQSPRLDARCTYQATPEHPASLTDTFASIYPRDAQRFGYHTPYPSGVQPDPSKKVYCSHWIKTGECSFIQQGCRYKHEMPNLEKLRELGVTQIPKWWKEKSAITARGPTWMQQRLAAGHGDDSLAGEMPPPRAFPDPSTFRSTQAVESISPGMSRQPHGVLQKGLVSEELENLQVLRKPTLEATTRPEKVIANLLIDIDDEPVTSYSPQSSHCSSASARSRRDRTSSASSATSSPPASLLYQPTTGITASIESPHIAEEALKERTMRRRMSQAPNNEQSEAKDNCAPVKSTIKNIEAPRKASPESPAPLKQTGLAKSKHSVTRNILPDFPDSCSKNGAHKTQSEQVKTSTGDKFRNAARAKGRAVKRASIESKSLANVAKRVAG